MVHTLLAVAHFNTSYVVIKHLSAESFMDIYLNFNTSYVVIKLCLTLLKQHLMPDFNTSYVVIKRSSLKQTEF